MLRGMGAYCVCKAERKPVPVETGVRLVANVVGTVVRTQVMWKITGLGWEMEFILNVMGSNWETLNKGEIPSVCCFIKIILTAM